MIPPDIHRAAPKAIRHLEAIVEDPDVGTTHSRLAAVALMNMAAKSKQLALAERNIRLREAAWFDKHPIDRKDKPKQTQAEFEQAAKETAKVQREYVARTRAWKHHHDQWVKRHGGKAPPMPLVNDPYAYHPLPDTYLPDPAYHGNDAYAAAAEAIDHDPTPPRTRIKRVNDTTNNTTADTPPPAPESSAASTSTAPSTTPSPPAWYYTLCPRCNPNGLLLINTHPSGRLCFQCHLCNWYNFEPLHLFHIDSGRESDKRFPPAEERTINHRAWRKYCLHRLE